MKGIRGGMDFSASITVDIGTLELDLAQDPIEKVIEVSAELALKEFRKTELQFEGLQAI